MKYLHTLDARQVIETIKEHNDIYTDYRPSLSDNKSINSNDNYSSPKLSDR